MAPRETTSPTALMHVDIRHALTKGAQRRDLSISATCTTIWPSGVVQNMATQCHASSVRIHAVAQPRARSATSPTALMHADIRHVLPQDAQRRDLSILITCTTTEQSGSAQNTTPCHASSVETRADVPQERGAATNPIARMSAGTHDASHRSAARRDPGIMQSMRSTMWRGGTANDTVDSGMLFTPATTSSAAIAACVVGAETEVAVGALVDVSPLSPVWLVRRLRLPLAL